jgi:hypothetical protein
VKRAISLKALMGDDTKSHNEFLSTPLGKAMLLYRPKVTLISCKL